MLTLNITITADVIAQGSVYVAMYGQSDGFVYFDGTGYVPIADAVPTFATYTAAGINTVTLPDQAIAGGEIVFGIGAAPAIAVNGGVPALPTQLASTGVFDVVEITCTPNGTSPPSYTVYVDTTMIEQFGLPIQIQIDPPQPSLPNGAGVFLDRTDVFSQFTTYVTGTALASDFLECAEDPFGNPLTANLLSPKDVLLYNSVQGVTAAAVPGASSTLASGTYFYGVTAMPTGAGSESYCQPTVVQATTTADAPAVVVSWGATQPTVTTPAASFNVYRGTVAGSGPVQWVLLGNVPSGTGGGSYTDDGSVAADQPATIDIIDPLTTYFDAQIQAFFAAQTQEVLTLTATDGTANGAVYTLSGQTASNGAGQLVGLQLSIASVAAPPGASPAPVAAGTVFTIYYPYWNTNTFDPALPAPPATPGGETFELYATVPASMMVFAAAGVFADSGQQPVPEPVILAGQAGQYQAILGGIENQVVSALTRGIANYLVPLQWAAAPTQVAPALAAEPSELTPGQTYYYVVSAVTDGIESTGSLEFQATPTQALPSVRLSWLPQAGVDSYNVYRGTTSQQENVLVANVSNADENASSYLDQGSAGTTRTPWSYFPAGETWDAYDAFFHQPSVTLNGAAYASPYDDQGGQSSTLAGGSVTSVSITVGPWGPQAA